jgi:hypothetical protein
MMRFSPRTPEATSTHTARHAAQQYDAVVLFGMQNRTLDPCLAAVHGIVVPATTAGVHTRHKAPHRQREGAGGEDDLQADETVAARVQVDGAVLLRVLDVLACMAKKSPLQPRSRM